MLKLEISNEPPRVLFGSFIFTPSISTVAKFGSPPRMNNEVTPPPPPGCETCSPVCSPSRSGRLAGLRARLRLVDERHRVRQPRLLVEKPRTGDDHHFQFGRRHHVRADAALAIPAAIAALAYRQGLSIGIRRLLFIGYPSFDSQRPGEGRYQVLPGSLTPEPWTRYSSSVRLSSASDSTSPLRTRHWSAG